MNEAVAVILKGEAVAEAWRRYLGVPYYYGGESMVGIDCSGLIRRGWAELAVWPFDDKRTADLFDADATADMIWKECARIPWEDRQAGDVVCFGTADRCSHVVGVLSPSEFIGANGGTPPREGESKVGYVERMRLAKACVKIVGDQYRYRDRLGVVRSPMLLPYGPPLR